MGLKGHAEVRDDPAQIADVLRRQLAVFQPSVAIADPLVAQGRKLSAIRPVALSVEEVAANFKYGGNVDHSHRGAVIDRLRARRGAETWPLPSTRRARAAAFTGRMRPSATPIVRRCPGGRWPGRPDR